MYINEIRQELAQLNDVKPLKGQHYAACLQTYESASNQRELILGWLQQDVIPQLSKESASFLSIGCGAGELDEKILEAGLEHASIVSYVGLEPDSQQCERFMARMESGNTDNISVETHNASFEQFDEQRRFDLVLMVHSLYYMDDPALALENALNLVNESGQLVIMIASNDTLNELSSSFWELEYGESWYSEDLSKHLELQNIPFECNRIEAQLDITSCCEPDSKEGSRIADFVAQVPTGELPSNLRKMIFSYLEKTSHREGDTHWLPHNVDAFIIQPTE